MMGTRISIPKPPNMNAMFGRGGGISAPKLSLGKQPKAGPKPFIQRNRRYTPSINKNTL